MRCIGILTSILILALATIGCEREQLSYQASEPPQVPDSVPVVPGGPNVATAVAQHLVGEWNGTMFSTYIDDEGKPASTNSQVTFKFQTYTDGAINGNGHEASFIDGRCVWQMSFLWAVNNDSCLTLRYSDKHLMRSTMMHLDGHSLQIHLVSPDALEHDDIQLTRVISKSSSTAFDLNI